MPVPAGLPETFYCTEKIDFSKDVDASNLKGKSVVVTGGANGLGAGSVKAFAEAGAYVTILDINEEQGNAVSHTLNAAGHHVQFTKTDMTSFSSQTAGFKSALSFAPSKSIDIVLASAGLSGTSIKTWVDNLPTSQPDAEPELPTTVVIDVNLMGVYYTAHLALFYFKQTATSGDAASKQLILISSLAGYVTLSNVADYNASKYGVRGFWRAIRQSRQILGPDTPPFRTNLIAPTFMRTNMTTDVEPALTAMGIEFGAVEDVVAGIMRVACDESIYGRTVAIAAGKEAPGDRNWDLCDDWEGLDGGRDTLGGITDGRIRGLELCGLGNYGRDNPFREMARK